ncbi:MAG: bifunctional glutamate N-acetyltransferase/amino-acid acetyltransferase ArgJ [Lachnospiraceae bacterium]|nr:bifunctional glutamate N-acetyltransferase/amino-acid acetyltransferase ArgJ [Lachnospiraceae bacterium]
MSVMVDEKLTVCSPKGFKAANTAAGIKYEGRDDMAMIYSKAPCVSAGTYTKNMVKAAPVLFDKERTKSDTPINAIVINAGIANACTGDEGFEICNKTTEAAAKALKIESESVLVASTGVIGKQIPVDKITAGCKALSKKLSDTNEAGIAAAKAIMTTDTIPKYCGVEIEVGGKKVTIGGMTKGSGMIHPDMCTMLCFITTDCNIEKALLQKALLSSVNNSFNMISVDGDTSTNDTCVVIANGLAENEKITEEKDDYNLFKEALQSVCFNLARKMAGDGEGATALFEVEVNGAPDESSAKILAKSVIGSSLTKAAIFGHDANWGRILCALGYSGVAFDPYKVDVTVTGNGKTLMLCKGGMETDYSEDEATEILSAKEVRCICEMNSGNSSAVAMGCDLSYDYVKINADYRS